MTKVLPLLALALLDGCILFAAGVGVVAIAASTRNKDPVAFNQEGVGTRDYAVSFDRCWSAVESGLRGSECVVEPALRSATMNSIKGRTKDGRPLVVRASRVSTIARVEVQVGLEDSEENRAATRAIHERIDADFAVVRRHYATSFNSVWDASQKTSLAVDQRVQPDDRFGQISAKLADGTPVVITIQRLDGSRTRVTVEAGTQASAASQQQALDVSHEITKALGVASEEGD